MNTVPAQFENPSRYFFLSIALYNMTEEIIHHHFPVFSGCKRNVLFLIKDFFSIGSKRRIRSSPQIQKRLQTMLYQKVKDLIDTVIIILTRRFPVIDHHFFRKYIPDAEIFKMKMFIQLQSMELYIRLIQIPDRSDIDHLIPGFMIFMSPAHYPA